MRLKLLTREDPNAQVFNWQDDPTLKTGQAKIAALDQKAATIGRELSRAETAMYEAQQVFEDTLLNELLERKSARDVEEARVAYHQAKEAYDRLTTEKAPLDRARTRIREELEPLQAEAKKDTLLRLRRAYAHAVTALAEALSTAEAANAEVARLHRLSVDCAPASEPWGALEPLFWREFLDNPNAQDGGKLGHWRIRAKEVLSNGT